MLQSKDDVCHPNYIDLNIQEHIDLCNRGYDYAVVPTTEQMIGWLEEQGQSIEVSRLYRNNPNWSAFVDDTQIVGKYYSSRKESILAAIDTALDYLKNEKDNF